MSPTRELVSPTIDGAARAVAASLAGFEAERLGDGRHLLGLLPERLGQVLY
jgi:hypothetical protein